MAHKFDPSRKELLDSPDRRRWQDPEVILETFGIDRGMVIVDIGCGTGYFARPAARRVGPGGGRVYAVDMQEEMLWALQSRLLKEVVENVLPVLSLESGIPLPASCADAALLMNALHELAGDATLEEIRRILRPKGFLAVVDWKKEPMEQGPPLEHRLSREEAEERLKLNSFLPEEVEVGPFHYGLKAFKGR
ncbi:MAG: class I SAM-dependent methyltransferase [Thermoplasmata archaeon]